MHDPLIQSFEIKYPWWKHKPWPKKFRHSRERKFTWEHRMKKADKIGRDSFWDTGYRDSFITIWHKDPERDGSDDSCGWSYLKLTNWQKERLWNGAWGESQNPHFLVFNGKVWEGSHSDAVSLYEGLIALTVRLLEVKVSADKIHRMAIERIHFPDCCDPRNTFCFQPGYHTNNPKDSKDDRQEHFYGILCGIARTILDDLRPWYKHPRWHLHHLRLQIHPLQNLKRRYWDKCCKCGKRGFKKGSAMSDWNGTRLWHDDCERQGQTCGQQTGLVPMPDLNPIISAITPNTFIHCGSDARTRSQLDADFNLQGGQDRTGLICACYRVRVMGWTKEQAEKEMLNNGFHKALHGLHEAWENFA